MIGKISGQENYFAHFASGKTTPNGPGSRQSAAPVHVPAVLVPVPVLAEVARRHLQSDKVMYAAAVATVND